MDNMMLIILSGALAVSIGLSLMALIGLRRWKRNFIEQESVVRTLREDVRALCVGAVGVDARVARVEQRSRRLKESQEQLELRDNGERLYAQAIRMVHKGASVDELVSVCGLSRGEAELISMMHRVDEAS